METAIKNYDAARSALDIFIDVGFPDASDALIALRKEYDRLGRKATRLFHEADWWQREYKACPTEATLSAWTAAQLKYQETEMASQAMWESWSEQAETYKERVASRRKELTTAVEDADIGVLNAEVAVTC